MNGRFNVWMAGFTYIGGLDERMQNDRIMELWMIKDETDELRNTKEEFRR